MTDSRFGSARRWLPLAALLAAGCAALPWPRAAVPRLAPGPDATPLLDLRGVVHVHTRVSSDSRGTLGELLDAAHSAGLDWIALTEHSRSASHAPARGMLEGVRLIPGYEVSAGGGSILALGVVRKPLRSNDAAAVVRSIHAQGGLALVGHLERSDLAQADRYAAAGADGIELVNLHATAAEQRIRLALSQLLLPAALGLRGLVRTPAANLERWAALPSADLIVAGVDAHAKFRLLGRFGGTLDRYRDVFRLVSTHVLAKDTSEAAILDALRAGRSYIAFEAIERVDRFVFEIAGGQVRLEAPSAARLVLVCDSHTVATLEARRLEARIPDGAGRCHGEAWRGDRLWIATSRMPAS